MQIGMTLGDRLTMRPAPRTINHSRGHTVPASLRKGLSAIATLSRQSVILLAIASAIVTANAYYVHPIIARVASDFGVSAALVGAVPAANQFALALGIFFLLPLGDQISNRRMAGLCLGAQTIALIVMATADVFWLFVAASSVLGFFTITPYLLPAFASKRVEAERLGAVTAILTTGVIAGVLFSRTGSGVLGEYFGWRNVYWIAAGLMAAATLIVPMIMAGDEPPKSRQSYGRLIGSLFTLVRAHPAVLSSGVIQGLSFGIFLAVWMGIGLHLTSPELGYGLDDVGFLAACAAINLLTTPRLGRWADAIGPRQARFYISLLQLAGVLTLFVTGHSIWALILPIMLMGVAGPMIDVTGRMTCLDQAPDIRTRLMSIYIVLMFLGGGIGSWAGTIAYDLGGWTGTALISLAATLLVMLMALSASRQTSP